MNTPRAATYVVALGANNVDEYYEAPYWPAVGTKVLVEKLSHEIGGMIANAACVMGHYGLETYILDVLGDDAYTDEILRQLDEHGVNRDHVAIQKQRANDKTLIVLTEGERTILVVESTKPDPTINPATLELIASARYLYTSIDGLALLGDVDGEDFSAIRKGGVRIVLDVEGASISDVERDRRYCHEASILIFNQSGFEGFGGGEAPVETASRFMERGVEIVVVTQGSRGCRVFSGGTHLEVPGIAVDVVDTTGAGDTFNASFVFGLEQGWDLLETAQFANAAAARSTLAFGPRTGCATVADVASFLRDRSSGMESPR